MTTVAEVRLWGTTIGAVLLEDGADCASFEYDRAFARSGIEVSPITMPLADGVFRFPQLARETFHGLSGLLADSLPDRFGNALINAWLATQGRPPDSMNAVERLCYTGRRGMGALEFEPVIGLAPRQATQIAVDQLVALASEILTDRTHLSTTFRDDASEALQDILRVGTSAGGARAKAIIAWNPHTNEVRSGQVATDPGFEYWLLKFDGVAGNRDKELEDPQGYGLIEYAYALMARDAGITMAESRLFEEGGRHHFMTRRFDRLDSGEKLHMQSLCALAHYDFNMAGAYGYEQALSVARQLALSTEEIEQLYRRMVFNIVARNQDDHTKNVAFLMDRRGRWSLAPAFDVTYSYNPDGRWTSRHQMSLNGKRDAFTLDDFKACARTASLQRGRAESIVAEVQSVAAQWHRYAQAAGVPRGIQNTIVHSLRLERFKPS